MVSPQVGVLAEDGEVAGGVVARRHPQFSEVGVRALSFRLRIGDDHLDAGQKLKSQFRQCLAISFHGRLNTKNDSRVSTTKTCSPCELPTN